VTRRRPRANPGEGSSLPAPGSGAFRSRGFWACLRRSHAVAVRSTTSFEIEPNVIVDVIVIDLRSGSEATGGSETRPYNRDKGDVNVGAIHESPLRCLAAEQDLVAATACRTLPLTACGEEVCDPQRQRPRPKHWESSRASRT